MKILILILIFSTSVFAKDRIEFSSENLSFKYMSFEGDEVLSCKHKYTDEFHYDLDVECGENKTKKFRVHLSLKRYERPMEPKNTYELLYWVTDFTIEKLSSNGSSMWLNLKEQTNFQGLTISQSVAQDTAGLYLDIKAF